MQINVNTDKTIDRTQGLDEHVQTVVGAAVQRFGEQITRIEVHLSDENSEKSADGGSRCTLEARVTGYQPVAVSNHAATLHQAINGAADKLKRAIDSALGRLHDKNLHDKPQLAEEALSEQRDDQGNM
ncbi:HPF/RaiA family ribosome-associated protein [Massilia sp. GCM10020059]|uniref:HPF/RaiA family ribosome-associated protein n=1 Tax=Massilia agrisoli TaxID=2892444 RepID=A0ABS8INA0_9BURK|nr:HPF/RaiA family ribosome-associated protein [Massilia agrisoli]MCC6070034.1 HPF/RaiA family ribosome-associated protein [Massilia agrisoli]